jgi:hypothetical protein
MYVAARGPIVVAANKNSANDRPVASGTRATAPVFVVGSARCGTKLLYYTLLSAGGFAIAPSETHAFNMLGAYFGDLARRTNRRRLLDAYLTSQLFQQTGLDRGTFENRVMENCRNAGDFLRIFLETVARQQRVHRWAESTPLHLLYLPLIKKLIPDALVLHIIRDGRDVAASLQRAGWNRPLPWDRNRAFLSGAIYWRWIVGKGRCCGQALGDDYMEVHYEDLVRSPRETLLHIGKFIEHDLDYDHIQQVALETVRSPNSSFRGDGAEIESNPIGRWKRIFTPAQVCDIEASIGDLLVDTGYRLETPPDELHRSQSVRFMNFLYPKCLDLKLWLESCTPLTRIAKQKRLRYILLGESATYFNNFVPRIRQIL